MIIVRPGEDAPETYSKSLFLAGPTPRTADAAAVYGWRADALAHLASLGYDGVVFVPEAESGPCDDCEGQVAWELAALKCADQIVFWIPRRMTDMPGLTTNVEFGRFFDSGRVVLGYPEDAISVRYLEGMALNEGVPVFAWLDATLAYAISRIGAGAERTGGERCVPLNIWKTPAFQAWHLAQKNDAGNRLDGAEVLWTFRVGPAKSFVFAFALHVDVHVTSEGRNKRNEFIIARPDIATIVGYRRVGPDPLDTEIAIVREFRSPARTFDGFIREVPGGSSWKPGQDPMATMAHELAEETGLGPANGFSIDPARVRRIGTRQLCGTLSTHAAHVFACELTAEELDYLRSQAGVPHGVEADTERTYPEVWTLGQIASTGMVDWAMMGMIYAALA